MMGNSVVAVMLQGLSFEQSSAPPDEGREDLCSLYLLQGPGARARTWHTAIPCLGHYCRTIPSFLGPLYKLFLDSRHLLDPYQVSMAPSAARTSPESGARLQGLARPCKVPSPGLTSWFFILEIPTSQLGMPLTNEKVIHVKIVV